ncbi:hypothetical protein Mar181_1361 [Marinomonas posidonica IVIA-Po-181]|uniref:Uncharacterized protein n=1 Tax=Marinomonas posidonica (strain CECT 7376 / NCIMB 14433 / IVIA-Po-181) TaxID=491952 RepID=F6CWQ4_MARPP|nr:hypothetical protein Mar181_1361 [Marinomonas posidonica IVIA-Po-181]
MSCKGEMDATNYLMWRSDLRCEPPLGLRLGCEWSCCNRLISFAMSGKVAFGVSLVVSSQLPKLLKNYTEFIV